MSRLFLQTFALALVLSACATPTPQPTATPTPKPTSTPVTADSAWVEAETYAVYEAILWPENRRTAAVLHPSTITDGVRIAALREYEMPTLKVSTVQNYNLNNQQSMSLKIEKFSSEFTISFLEVSSFHALFADTVSMADEEAVWDAFSETYSGAGDYLLLSRVGFSNDGLQALVFYIGHGCYIEELLLLEKQANSWQIVGRSVRSIC